MSSQFHVTEEPWGHHYKVVASDGEGGKRHYFVENSQYASKQTDLTIHDGTEIDGPIVGLSKFRRFTSNCDIRLDEAGEWLSLAKKGVVTPNYTFQIPLHGQMTHLTWKKTRSMGSFYGPYGNLKLVDEQSHVLAVFSSDGDSLVTGRLDMYGDYGESFDRMALLTALAVRERSRRQTTRSARVGHENVYTTGAACGGAGGGAC
ncbi:hypothetical protein N7474_002171 [Penicillium riverlandense]|uniref:uncharacterized protein n=1 Tax=Penicillium riverlandense TaxID=1903569 RepID=UPI002549549B|nr:uncharacterized protein N7474_002171 [Penicillium riverlandense]KAJ5833860.1 hypothetical protein N7474_002171 [Penicillium riverlandense]